MNKRLRFASVSFDGSVRQVVVVSVAWAGLITLLLYAAGCGLEQLGPPLTEKTEVYGDWQQECVEVAGVDWRLCRIPAGWVETGGHLSLEPVRRFAVAEFWLADTPVTNADYERFRPDHPRDEFSPSDNSAVTSVSWYEAGEYLSWLEEDSGLSLRLPTFYEWHYACLGGQQGPLPWGSYRGRTRDEQKTMANILALEAAPVRSHRPGPFGLHEMVGGVSEWMADWRVYDPEDGDPIFDDHPAYDKVQKALRAVKGCSAANASFVFCECNYTTAYDPKLGLGSIGFRVAASGLPAAQSPPPTASGIDSANFHRVWRTSETTE